MKFKLMCKVTAVNKPSTFEPFHKAMVGDIISFEIPFERPDTGNMRSYPADVIVTNLRSAKKSVTTLNRLFVSIGSVDLEEVNERKIKMNELERFLDMLNRCVVDYLEEEVDDQWVISVSSRDYNDYLVFTFSKDSGKLIEVD